MSDKLKDILSNLSSEVDQETLLKYLEGRLSDEQRHEVEKKKKKREKLRFKDQPWLYIAIFIILLLIVLSYMVIQKMLQQ